MASSRRLARARAEEEEDAKLSFSLSHAPAILSDSAIERSLGKPDYLVRKNEEARAEDHGFTLERDRIACFVAWGKVLNEQGVGRLLNIMMKKGAMGTRLGSRLERRTRGLT